jgi:hypothetical protein
LVAAAPAVGRRDDGERDRRGQGMSVISARASTATAM